MRAFTITLAVSLAIVGLPACAQEIKTHHVKGNIYMLEGQGGNIGVSIGDDGILVIDDQFANIADKNRAAIRKLQDGDLTFIINTHHHGDHTGGNEVLGAEAPIIAQTKLRERLAKGKDLSDPTVRQAIPTITFDETLSLHFIGEEIRLVHFPTGHTDNDSVIYFTESNVVHMGDHFFVGRFPFIDLAGGGDVESYIQNVKKVIAGLDNDVKIIPGHGPLATLKDLKDFVKLVEHSVDVVRKGIADGKNLDQIKKDGLPKRFSEAGSGFVNADRWMSIVHQSLTR